MPPLLQCQGISHSLGTKTLFRELDLTINSGDRIGLVGHNGSGKSTLLSIINGREAPDSGDISRNRGLLLETVEQFIDPALESETLLAAVIDKLPAEESITGQYQAEQMLTSLGFSSDEYGYQVRDLSGGQQNRLMFARALITSPDLILFDEPTNHLDLSTLLVFEKFLHDLRAAFLIISHDRAFLDATTHRTVFLRDERIYNFDLPFSKARQQLDAHDEAAQAAREQEQKDIARLQSSANRLATWGKVYDNEKFARKAKSMEKRIDKLKEEQTFVTRGSGLKLSLDVSTAQANRMLQIEHHDVLAPDDSALFHIEDMMIRPGDRVALLGANGAGKTTLIKLIMEAYAHNRSSGSSSGSSNRYYKDTVKFNPQCDIGYYDQELHRLDSKATMISALRDACDGGEADLKSALIRAGFPYRDLDKSVAVLSGGEKARLMFLIIKLNQPNFLILDEPTNHIDIQGKEELEEQILSSNATVVITSHDRRFVDTIAKRFLLIRDGRLHAINNPNEFYEGEKAISQVEKQETGNHKSAVGETDHGNKALGEEEILARIVTLEALLEADLARKEKFQKPSLQAQWQDELDHLNAQL